MPNAPSDYEVVWADKMLSDNLGTTSNATQLTLPSGFYEVSLQKKVSSANTISFDLTGVDQQAIAYSGVNGTIAYLIKVINNQPFSAVVSTSDAANTSMAILIVPVSPSAYVKGYGKLNEDKMILDEMKKEFLERKRKKSKERD